MIRVEQDVIHKMITHAVNENPLESCGLLTRRHEVIDGIQHCSNALESRTRFEIPPQELFEFFRALRDSGRHFAGIYHSHPKSPPEPSPYDVDSFHYPGVSYWIVSLAAQPPRVACFQWEADVFEPAEFSVESAGVPT